MINSCMSDRATKRIANYIISDRKIGGGNFGQVYLGTDALDDSSQVAIKVISRAKLTGIVTVMQTKIQSC